eukprot:snap_masked-scaffold_32-processed-gene-0.19-mRNA-1 protein AED:1.00 eAED:1.00 QI:0/-1/0/0/-1/1/1/0/314
MIFSLKAKLKTTGQHLFIKRYLSGSASVFDIFELKKRIIYEDNHLLVVNKPCGIISQPNNPEEAPTRDRETSLVSLYKNYLKQEYNKPGNVHLQVVNRLDKPVSGVSILAKTSKATSRLQEQIRIRNIEKEYIAVVEGNLSSFGKISAEKTYSEHWKSKKTNNRANLNRVGRQKFEQNKKETIHYSPIHFSYSPETKFFNTVVGVKCKTGKRHQIRRLLSEKGYPVVNDYLYGSKQRIRNFLGEEKIALHASFFSILHPIKSKGKFEFFCPPTREFFNGVIQQENNFDQDFFGKHYYNEEESRRLISLRENLVL